MKGMSLKTWIRFIIYGVFFYGVFMISAAITAEEDGVMAECENFTPFGQPTHMSLGYEVGLTNVPEWTVICHMGQVVAFNPERNVSDWVAFSLRREDLLNPVVERKDRFHPDPKVPKQNQVVHDDYTKTGYDRGHLAPAASMKWSEEAMDDSFFMTNIAPQVGVGFNQHIWKALERKMRQWACVRGALYVVTGPLYEEKPIKKLVRDKDGDEVDDNGILVHVPTHFFKFAIDPKTMESIAFILPNRKLKTKDLPKYLTSIDNIETRARLDALTALSDDVEYIIESRVQPHLWEEPDNECRELR